jgi:hypothetical protein
MPIIKGFIARKLASPAVERQRRGLPPVAAADYFSPWHSF